MKLNIFQLFQDKKLLYILLLLVSNGCSIISNDQAGNYSVKTIKLNKLTIMHSDSTLFTNMYMYYCVYKGKPIMIYHDKKCSDCLLKFNRFNNDKIRIIQQDKFIDKDFWFQHNQFSYGSSEILINKDVMLFKLVE